MFLTQQNLENLPVGYLEVTEKLTSLACFFDAFNANKNNCGAQFNTLDINAINIYCLNKANVKLQTSTVLCSLAVAQL